MDICRDRLGAMLTTLPNLLTLSRIVVIPLLVGTFFLDKPLANCHDRDG